MTALLVFRAARPYNVVWLGKGTRKAAAALVAAKIDELRQRQPNVDRACVAVCHEGGREKGKREREREGAGAGKGEREGERARGRESERARGRERGRETERNSGRQRRRDRGRHTETESGTERDKQSGAPPTVGVEDSSAGCLRVVSRGGQSFVLAAAGSCLKATLIDRMLLSSMPVYVLGIPSWNRTVRVRLGPSPRPTFYPAPSSIPPPQPAVWQHFPERARDGHPRHPPAGVCRAAPSPPSAAHQHFLRDLAR
jgi:hypothetical protein